MTDATNDDLDLDKVEQAVRIRQMLADIDVKLQARQLEPWKVVTLALTAGAGLFAAGAAFVKLFG